MGTVTDKMGLSSGLEWRRLGRLTLLLALLHSGCGKSGQPSAHTPVATVSRPLERQVVEWDEYPGQLQSPESVNVSSRVSGIVDAASFEEGSLVKKADLLFVIDDRPFAADLKSKEAELGRAQAQLAQAQARFKRIEQLKGSRAISEQDYDEALAGFRQAQAAIAAAEAARDVSKLSLEWTKVISPISGRVGRKLVTAGNLVNGGSGQPTLLTRIVSQDPIHCYVSVPERSYLSYQARGGLTSGAGVPVFIKLSVGGEYTTKGTIDFVDNRVDPATGTVQIRGVFPNRDGKLTPGLFARMRIPGEGPYMALLIPDRAIGSNQDSRFVLVVGKDGTIEQKTVQRGALFGTLRAIVSGVHPGDLVVVTGIQQLKPGIKVEISEVPIADDSLKDFLVADSPDTPAPVLAK